MPSSLDHMLPPYAAFLTGSHAYGTPHQDSDVDLVVLMTVKDAKKLFELLRYGQLASDLDRQYISAGGTPVRLGNLNLLVCVNRKQYRVWRQGTKELKSRRPVSREAACEHFRNLRREAGFSVG